ncbi:MAG: hypothetical protein LBS68_00715 [Puniceicoccales bacterium]|jgi:hypothetical protein|nr:hypothetical protein [Puniceicoccales bacterium]
MDDPEGYPRQERVVVSDFEHFMQAVDEHAERLLGKVPEDTVRRHSREKIPDLLDSLHSLCRHCTAYSTDAGNVFGFSMEFGACLAGLLLKWRGILGGADSSGQYDWSRAWILPVPLEIEATDVEDTLRWLEQLELMREGNDTSKHVVLCNLLKQLEV